MSAYVVEVLCHVRHGHGDQLLGLPLRIYARTKRLVYLGEIGSQALSLPSKLLGLRRIYSLLFEYDSQLIL